MDLIKLILFLFASIGVINGFLLGIYLLFNYSKKIYNFYFGGLLLALSIRIGKSIYVYFSDSLDLLILQIGLSACIFVGPLFYLFARSYLREESHFRIKDIALLLLLSISIIGVGIKFPYRSNSDIWNHQIIFYIYNTWLIFLALGIYECRLIITKIFKTKIKLIYAEKYLLGVALGMLFITSTFQFALYIDGFTYLWGALIFTAVFYYLMVKALTTSHKLKNKAIGNHTDKIILSETQQKVNLIVEEKYLYKDPKLKLETLALETGVPKNELSKILNNYYGGGFTEFINSKRIEYAKSILASRPDLSLEGIGYESGFNSKSTFFAVFKKMTKQTPSQYKTSIKA